MGNNKCRPAYKAATMWQCQHLHICNKCLWTLLVATAASSPTLTSLKLLFIWVHASHTRIPRTNVFAAMFSAPLGSVGSFVSLLLRQKWSENILMSVYEIVANLVKATETDQRDSQMTTSLFITRLVHNSNLASLHLRYMEYNSNVSSANT